MKNKWEVVIGVEIHLALNTKTKMFSPSLNKINQEPNTNIHPIDLGYPGTLPRPNKQAILKAIFLAKALNMKIDSLLRFDRKNYFYPDLPKGYQITQQFHPIGSNGYVKLKNSAIAIDRIHLEEDTAKSFHIDNQTLLDFNRAGVPLIEIVTKPDIHSAEETIEYLLAIKNIAKFLNISDAKMEDGSFRVDVNISLKKPESKILGTKVEIKNMNSLANIKKAIEIEIMDQANKLEAKEKIIQCTKRFDEESQSTKIMRAKNDAIDYKFFPEPNINPISLSKNFIDSIILPKLPFDIRNDLLELKISEDFIEQIINDKHKYQFIKSIGFANKKESIKIFFAEIIPLAKANNCNIENLKLNPLEIKIALENVQKGLISNVHLKKIIKLLVNSELKTAEIIKKEKMFLLSDVKLLKDMINVVIEEHSDLIEKNKNREERVFKLIIGQIMKKTKGQANPIIVNQILKQVLKLDT